MPDIFETMDALEAQEERAETPLGPRAEPSPVSGSLDPEDLVRRIYGQLLPGEARQGGAWEYIQSAAGMVWTEFESSLGGVRALGSPGDFQRAPGDLSPGQARTRAHMLGAQIAFGTTPEGTVGTRPLPGLGVGATTAATEVLRPLAGVAGSLIGAVLGMGEEVIRWATGGDLADPFAEPEQEGGEAIQQARRDFAGQRTSEN